MAFVSLRSRQRYLLLLLLSVAIYFLFSWLLIRRDSHETTNAKHRSSILSIQNIEQIQVVEKDAFAQKENLLIGAISHKRQTGNDDFIYSQENEAFLSAELTSPSYPEKAKRLQNPSVRVHEVSEASHTYLPLLEAIPDNQEENIPTHPFLKNFPPERDIDLKTDTRKAAAVRLRPKAEEVLPNAPRLTEQERSLRDIETKFSGDFTNFIANNTTKNPAFIIDTSGCRIPKLDPWDPTVLKFIELLDPLVCSDLPPFMTPQPNGIVHLDEFVLKKYYNSTRDNMACVYQEVRLNTTVEHTSEEDIYLKSAYELVFDTEMDADHIAIQCTFKNGYVHEQYMPMARLKVEVEIEKFLLKPSTPLNVILFGIDSISKLNFFRHFRRTKEFIREKMNVFDMKGYTKVADNTFPNLTPMLTGHFVDYYWDETMAKTYFFDNMNLIWKEYSRKGYRTFFAEDAPFNGIFNYYKKGFLEQPTDYYYRPTALMLEKSVVRQKVREFNSTCVNSELEMDIIDDYLINFIKTMAGRPYFAFAMHSTLTHDELNFASYTDAPSERLLKALDEEGALNNTLLIMFSDHGIRYGSLRFTYIGKFEERMPFMYIHVPKWFLKQNPEIERNLIINQDRLITLFDVHATLKHLLNLDQDLPNDTDELGLSLFKEIPENRTCEDANISEHWCPCTDFESVPLNDPNVTKAANAIVSHINQLLLPYTDVCETLELKEVTDALRGLPNDLVLQFIGVQDNVKLALGGKPPTLGDYLITLRTRPGDAMFEGTVRYDEANDVTNVMDVSRINMYGKQSWCIDSPKLKLYCYCKTQIT